MKGIRKFVTEYDTSHEDAALHTRGQFITAFPLNSLDGLTLDQYVVGHGTPTFCNLVESGTKAWANIQGANSFKFGVYFGRTKGDPARRYRFAVQFGANERDAFRAVKAALLDLVKLGARTPPDYAAIDANPLSQMFKAKILSLYYPERFLPVCSAEHLEMLGSVLGFADGLPFSEYQSLLLTAQRRNAITRGWSSPKFMAFLYRTYVRADRAVDIPIERPRKKKHRRVNFEEMQKQRAEIGQRAEKFALQWEKERLSGADLGRLIDRIEDRRERPGYGHDFCSFSSEDVQRYIEVKSVAKLKDGHRFFLSDNEHRASKSAEHRSGYYFYLVFFDGKGNPVELIAVRAQQFYRCVEMLASSYEVRFDRRKLAKER